MKNYIKVRNWVPFLSSYMYIDTYEHIADDLFADHDINFVWFGANELYCKDNGFIFVKCTIKSSCESLFEVCMEHLERNLRFSDEDMEQYEYLCSIFELIESGDAEILVDECC